jgi:mRNA interferase MazF
MMICDAGDVVVISFPGSKESAAKPRPALVVSQRDFNQQGCSILTMITDARHPPRPFDSSIRHESVGLKLESIVRMKLFTVENDQILKRLGDLSGQDRQRFLANLRKLLR